MNGERSAFRSSVAPRLSPPLQCIMFSSLQLAGQALSTAAIPIKVQLIAPPLYVMTTQCLDKVAGIAALTAAIAATKKVIDAKGGQLNVKMAVSVVSAAHPCFIGWIPICLPRTELLPT